MSINKRKRIVLLSLLLLVVALCLAFVGYKHYSSKDSSGSSSIKTADNKALSSEKATPSYTKASSTSTPEKSSNNTVPLSSALVSPSGNFVSDHHPDISGSPNPSSMESECTTNPGATCQISFTNDGTTESLPIQTVDSNGTTYWYWTLQNVGLTQGTWTIQAVASLNGQTKVSMDPQNLVVGP